MQIIKSLLMVGCFSLSQSLFACTATWTGLGLDQLWDNTANWNSGCFPDAFTDTATFNSATAPNTVDVDSNSFDLNTITFNTTGQSYTLIGGNGVLIFPDIGAGGLSVISGTHTIEEISLFNNTGSGTIPVNISGVLYQNDSEISANNLPIILTGQWITEGNGGIGVNTIAAQTTATLSGGGLLQVTDGLIDFSTNAFTTFTTEDTSIILDDSTMLIRMVNFLSGSMLSQNSSLITGSTYNHGSGSFINDDSTFSVNFVNFLGGSVVNRNNGEINSDIIFISSETLLNDVTSQMEAFAFQQIQGTVTNNGYIEGFQYVLNDAGVVKGDGVFELVFLNSGTVIPGDEHPGHLSIGDYNQNSDGALVINFLNDNRFGVLDTFEAELDGRLDLVALPGFIPTRGKFYTILTSIDPDIDGEFEAVQSFNISPYFEPQVLYFDDRVDVEFASLFPGLISSKEALFSTQNQINFLLLRQIDRMVSRGCCSCDWNFDAFIAPVGSAGAVYRRGEFLGYNFNTVGLLVGGDVSTPFGGIGASFDYEHLFLHGKHRFGQADIDRYHGNIYGGLRIVDNLFLNAIVGGGSSKHDFERRILSGLSLFTHSRPTTREVSALLGLEYALCVCDVTFVPFVDYQYAFLDYQRVREHGDDDDYALEFPYQKYESNRSILGFRLNTLLCLGGLSLIPEINFAWEREFSNKDRLIVTEQELPLPAFINPSTGRNTFFGGFDVETFLSEGFSVDLSYEFEGNARYINNFFYVGFNGYF